MSRGRLWACSAKGNVFSLKLSQKEWDQVPNQTNNFPGFKKVVGTPMGCWGIGADHQIYVFVQETDLPIRVTEVILENERWVPGRGWAGKNLFLNDPWDWSSEDLSRHTPKDSVQLPSSYWTWESEWYIDNYVKGHKTDKEGWRYSDVGFRQNFTHQKTMFSCVRQRRWLRSRRYTAESSWAKLPELHLNPTAEPFMDITVGAYSLENIPPLACSVWVTTINGCILHRVSVKQSCPEGQSWTNIELPAEHCEIKTVSAGPTYRVWAVTWYGAIYTRTGISWQNLKGEGWLVVPAPDDLPQDDQIQVVAVGERAVWTLSNQGRLWARKLEGPEDVIGDIWLNMGSKMRQIAVGPNDQVFAIDDEECNIYFRSGIDDEEFSGRYWRVVDLKFICMPVIKPAHFESLESLNETNISENASQEIDEDQYLNNNVTVVSSVESHGTPAAEIINDSGVDCGTPPSTDSICENSAAVDESTLCSNVSVEDKGALCSDTTSDESRSALCSGDPAVESTLSSDKSAAISKNNSGATQSSKIPFPRIKAGLNSLRNRNAKFVVDRIKNVDPKLLITGIQHDIKETKTLFVRQAKDAWYGKNTSENEPMMTVSFSNDLSKDEEELERVKVKETEFPQKNEEHLMSSDYAYSLNLAESETADEAVLSSLASEWTSFQTEEEGEHILWTCVSPSSLYIEKESDLTHWITTDSVSAEKQQYLLEKQNFTWRQSVVDTLKTRNHMPDKFDQYKPAVEKTSWKKTGNVSHWLHSARRPRWAPCEIELEQESNEDEGGHISLSYEQAGAMQNTFINLKDVLCIQNMAAESKSSVIALHTLSQVAQIPKVPPLLVAMETEEDMEDWMRALSVASSESHGVLGPASPGSLWAVSSKGAVFGGHRVRDQPMQIHWQQYGGFLSKVECNASRVVWGLAHCGTVYVYTGGYGGGFLAGTASSPSGIFSVYDVFLSHIYENQRWRVGKGYTDRTILVSHLPWSDASGYKAMSKDCVQLPSRHCHWLGDWTVDYTLPPGTDKEGWQYGRHHGSYFYQKPRFNSTLRRRRWVRRSQATTSGPWQQVVSPKLKDISLQPLVDRSEGTTRVALWGVTFDDRAVCRTGVTPTNVQGDGWIHVPCDRPLTSICVAMDAVVWATAKDGSICYRKGISAENATGTRWDHIPAPYQVVFKSITVGQELVLCIDTNNSLWCQSIANLQKSNAVRTWHRVRNNVRCISAGLSYQLWAVLDQVQEQSCTVDGVLAYCSPPKDYKQAWTWLYHIGGGFKHITARGWLV